MFSVLSHISFAGALVDRRTINTYIFMHLWKTSLKDSVVLTWITRIVKIWRNILLFKGFFLFYVSGDNQRRKYSLSPHTHTFLIKLLIVATLHSCNREALAKYVRTAQVSPIYSTLQLRENKRIGIAQIFLEVSVKILAGKK